MTGAPALLRERVRASGARVVTAAHDAATAAGIAAYAQGGNAFDAALAACLMETVALPMKCGLAGDLVALLRPAGGELTALVSVGPGALALGRGATLERVGPRAVGVPGAPAGYAALHAHARLGLDRLAAPAVRAAEAGLPWTRIALGYLHEAEALLRRHSPDNPYLPGGALPREGALRRLPGLAALLRGFAERGAALFEGVEGERLVQAVQARGGFLTMEDLRARPVTLHVPVWVALSGGAVLHATPAPTGGARLLGVMGRALDAPGRLLEIIRDDRREAKRRGRLPADGGTSVVTAADEAGNAVVVVHSNSFPQFGSGVVLESGLVLNNRPGRGFDLGAPPGAANAPAPGRVPATTLHAWALEREGEMLLGATPGGVNQLPWNAQTLTDLLGGATIADAVTAPRWALSEGDELTVEEGAALPPDAGARAIPPLSLRSAEQILRLAPARLPEAAADPRAGGCALASY